MNMSTEVEGYIRVVISIIVAIVLLWILIRFRASKKSSRSSLDILKERRDRGEITDEQYEQARKQQKGK